jgi:predicted exporter
MLAGLASTLALFRLTGTAVNMFHTIALPLVIALSIDYGIFMQAVLEGRMDRQGRNGVLLSALTTLAGFGSLLLARHPALFSLGMAVSSGIASALASALWLQPLLFAKKEGG